MGGRPLAVRRGMGRAQPRRRTDVGAVLAPRSLSASLSAALQLPRSASAGLSAQVDLGSGGGGSGGDPSFRYVNPARTVVAGEVTDGMKWSTAFTSLPTTLVRGLTYWLADGNYPARTFNTAPQGTTRITIKKATIASHGEDTSGGWSNAMGDGQATFTGGLTISMKYLTIDGQTGSWIRPSEIYGIQVNEVGDTTPAFSMQDGATDIELKHIQHNGKTSHGGGGSFANDTFSSYGAERVLISHFLTTSCGRCGLWGYTKDWLIEYYWLQHHYGTATEHAEVMSIWDTSPTERGMGNFEVRYSLFTWCQSSGGLLWDGVTNQNAQFTVHGCVFYRPAGTTWEIGNGAIGSWSFPTEVMSNVIAWNNTFIEARSSGGYGPLAGDGLGIKPIGCQARNNMFYSCNPVDWTNFVTHSHNHFISTTGITGDTSGTSGATDPFVDYVNFNFRLKANTTPGIDLTTLAQAAASKFPALPNAGAIDKDLYGNPRTTWSRGAIEFGS